MDVLLVLMFVFVVAFVFFTPVHLGCVRLGDAMRLYWRKYVYYGMYWVFFLYIFIDVFFSFCTPSVSHGYITKYSWIIYNNTNNSINSQFGFYLAVFPIHIAHRLFCQFHNSIFYHYIWSGCFDWITWQVKSWWGTLFFLSSVYSLELHGHNELSNELSSSNTYLRRRRQRRLWRKKELSL